MRFFIHLLIREVRVPAQLKYFLRFNSPKLEYHQGQNVNAEEQQRLQGHECGRT